MTVEECADRIEVHRLEAARFAEAGREARVRRAEAVREAVAEGYTYAELGAALGVTAQCVFMWTTRG